MFSLIDFFIFLIVEIFELVISYIHSFIDTYIVTPRYKMMRKSIILRIEIEVFKSFQKHSRIGIDTRHC